ncbi:MAG: zinc-binding dehydrogenase [Anaplasmataceae bacterium]|nr:zinc-binding dehydrogenase [Anaplasmataceae bacterium]
MPKFIELSKFGYKNLKIVERDNRPLKADEVLIKNKYIIPHDLDMKKCKGIIETKLPAVIGCDSVGAIVEIGDSVHNYKIGDLVSVCTADEGAYAEYRIAKDCQLNVIEKSSDLLNSALLYRNFFISYMFFRQISKKILPSYILLFNNITTPLGNLFLQHTKHFGVKYIIGTTPDYEKYKEKALALGAAMIFPYNSSSFISKILEYTSNYGVQVVYDTIGNKVFNQSINVLCKNGAYIVMDQSSKTMKDIPLDVLQKRSLSFQYMSLSHKKIYPLSRVPDLVEFEILWKKNAIRKPEYQIFKLSDIKEIHKKMENNEFGFVQPIIEL